MKTSSTNSRVIHLFIVIGVLFSALAVSLIWFEMYGKAPIMSSTYNKRMKTAEAEILRGPILDRNGAILAKSEIKNEVQVRVYPFKNLYTHVIGYDSETYGKTLLEAQYNDTLLGFTHLDPVSETKRLIANEMKEGYALTLTIDNALQQKCRALLGKQKGVIVAMDPNTGQILAMVSTPDFDPNDAQLSKKWDALTQNEDSPFLPRAIKGLYPPGSTFKIVTAAAAIEKGLSDTQFNDEGRIEIDGKTFVNYGSHVYGQLDMTRALAVSSNVYFAQLAELIGAKTLISKAEQAGITKDFSFDLPLTKSHIGDSSMGKTELAATAIGQGKLLVTPLQMAMIASAIANEGSIMKPYIVDRISSIEGKPLKSYSPKKLYQFTDGQTAETLKAMMVEVVKTGTGKKASVGGTTVAGKTGTAQTEKSYLGEGYDHAWFIGFAPVNEPQIAVAVILEYQGKGGGQAAAPIARQVMAQWLNNQIKNN